ncbi:MAG: 2-amino-3,7-dideoxy-D-threo-hept-6-ulosonate synthase [Candidatus Bathyarchaeota archaeon B24]|nr:MAG: 2-amino-3,7-dideoxy-D-threo-hept-6-ulosonate synthase [Candidatus Bathyarchaeota archaeon B24]
MVKAFFGIREGRFIDPSDSRGVLVDCTGELRLNLLVDKIGRERFKDIDGVIVYEDSVTDFLDLFLGKRAPGCVLRVGSRGSEEGAGREWAEKLVVNALRRDFSALIYRLTIGHEDERLDSSSMSAMTMLSTVCNEYELPLMAEVAPRGERVTRENYVDCVGLAARMAVEAGASVVAVPFLGDPEVFRKVVDAVKTPTFLIDPLCGYTLLKPRSSLQETVRSLLEAGLNGVILGPSLARSRNPDKLLADMLSIVHGGSGVGCR